MINDRALPVRGWWNAIFLVLIPAYLQAHLLAEPAVLVPTIRRKSYVNTSLFFFVYAERLCQLIRRNLSPCFNIHLLASVFHRHSNSHYDSVLTPTVIENQAGTLVYSGEMMRRDACAQRQKGQLINDASLMSL
jgi:hypothetical protein